MKDMEKIVYVAVDRRERTRVYSGTVSDLAQVVFGYTLECGWGRNPSINKNPKTLKSLISNLNKSVHETQGCCYNQDYYFATTKDEAIENGWSISEAI